MGSDCRWRADAGVTPGGTFGWREGIVSRRIVGVDLDRNILEVLKEGEGGKAVLLLIDSVAFGLMRLRCPIASPIAVSFPGSLPQISLLNPY